MISALEAKLKTLHARKERQEQELINAGDRNAHLRKMAKSLLQEISRRIDDAANTGEDCITFQGNCCDDVAQHVKTILIGHGYFVGVKAENELFYSFEICWED